MENLGLMEENEIAMACEFDIHDDTNIDAMAWSWSIAAKVALGVASAFL